jgi:hypothetical protein
MLPHRPALLLTALAVLPLAAQDTRPSEQVVLFERRSELLSTFWGREIKMQAGVVVPPDREPDEALPVCYSIHGFGASHRGAWRSGPQLVEKMRAGYPRMVYVFLNAQCPLGHHVFADSVNNGPWGTALVTEFLPALEKEHRAGGASGARFLTGHSSGGWSSLWLQITHPDVFGGVWSTSPDSVDFRDFTGIDIYRFENAYRDPEGKPIQLVRRRGEWATSLEEFVRREIARREYGGQFASFDAVFSPRGEDGRPLPLFDRKTGAIDRFVARSWEKYDMTLVLRRNWPALGPKLAGKLHVFMGTLDTFRLEGALYLLRDELKTLGSDAQIVFAEGRDHGSVMQAHELWPEGLLPRIHREMRARFEAGR